MCAKKQNRVSVNATRFNRVLKLSKNWITFPSKKKKSRENTLSGFWVVTRRGTDRHGEINGFNFCKFSLAILQMCTTKTFVTKLLHGLLRAITSSPSQETPFVLRTQNFIIDCTRACDLFLFRARRIQLTTSSSFIYLRCFLILSCHLI